MSFLKFDQSQAGGGDFAPLPVGEYEVVISEVKIDKSKAGNDMVKLTLTVRDNVDQPGQKRKFFDNMVVTEKAMFRFHQLIQALGFEQGHEFPTLVDFAKAIQFKNVRLKNKHEEYEGKQQDRVHYYMGTHHAHSGGQTAADPFSVPTGSTEIPTGDLPF